MGNRRRRRNPLRAAIISALGQANVPQTTAQLCRALPDLPLAGEVTAATPQSTNTSTGSSSAWNEPAMLSGNQQQEDMFSGHCPQPKPLSANSTATTRQRRPPPPGE